VAVGSAVGAAVGVAWYALFCAVLRPLLLPLLEHPLARYFYLTVVLLTLHVGS